MGYTKEAIKGISWLGALRVLTRMLSYGKIAIIARILTPAQYGSSDIALMILSLSEILTETGINIFLTQEKEDIDKYINTAWVVSIIRGLIISTVIFFSGNLVSTFTHTPSAYELLVVVSLVPVIRGFINPSVAKFVKELRFRQEFYYRTSIFLVETVISILVAVFTRSAVTIIAGLIIGALFEIILSFRLVKPVPCFRFEPERFREIIHRGKWMTATGIFNYFYHNGDNFVIVRMLGSAALGLYSRAYSISMLPITELSDVISKVTLPVFVKIADDSARLRRAYYRSILVVSVLAFSMGFLFYFYPELIINIILGPQWLSAAPALQVLAIFGIVRSVSMTSVAPFYAVKRQDIVTRVTLVSFLGLAVTIVPFVRQWGIVGAGYSALTGALAAIPVIAFYFHRVFNRNDLKRG